MKSSLLSLFMLLTISISAYANQCSSLGDKGSNTGSICLQHGHGYEIEDRIVFCAPDDSKLSKGPFANVNVIKLQPGDNFIVARKSGRDFAVQCEKEFDLNGLN